MDKEAALCLRGMTLEEKVGQLMIFAIPGKSLNRDNMKMLAKYKPGGVIFFGYNISGEKKTTEFCQDLQSYALKSYGMPLFITTDNEGGRVSRIKEGVEAFPGNLACGISEKYNLVSQMAKIQGLQLRKIGVNMNLAPVLDINNNPKNPVINTRSFGSRREVVAQMGTSYISGLVKGRVIPVAKHFPGHGDTASDSHYELPVINHGMDHLEKNELFPFIRAIEKGLDCIMTAHILYPEIEEEGVPATISRFFLTELLRKRYKFPGIIMTDDLKMKALSRNMRAGQAAVRSFKAGADILLISSWGRSIRSIHNSLLRAVRSGEISGERLDLSVKRILELKLRYGIAKFDKKTGRVSAGSFSLSEGDLQEVKAAKELNQTLSSAALYFRGENSTIFRNHSESIEGKNRSSEGMSRQKDNQQKKGENSPRRIYLCRSRVFKEELILHRGDRVVSSLGQLRGELARNASFPGTKEVVFQFFRVNVPLVKRVQKLCKKRGFELINVYSGNPFVYGVDSSIPVLFTFSPTEMSMKAAANVFNGKVIPRRSINCNLGHGSR